MQLCVDEGEDFNAPMEAAIVNGLVLNDPPLCYGVCVVVRVIENKLSVGFWFYTTDINCSFF